MATLLQLRAEPWWDREIITPELDWLGDEMCLRTERPRVAAGTKGDYAHLSGGHRSQEWIRNSRWCTSRSYTVQSGLTAEQARHVAAFDFTPGDPGQMIAQCKRLMLALRAGRLDEVLEFYGNVDGDQWVDGWDNLADRAVTSDSSHLWHWHITIDRRHLRNRALMERILAIALGTGEDTMTEADALKGVHSLWKQASDRSTPTGRQMSDYVRAVTAGTEPTREVWYALVGYDGAIPVPPNWANPANTHLALSSALSELLARAVASEDLPKAVADLTALVRGSGGNADIAALTEAIRTLAGATATLQAAVADLVARAEQRDAALARAYGQG